MGFFTRFLGLLQFLGLFLQFLGLFLLFLRLFFYFFFEIIFRKIGIFIFWENFEKFWDLGSFGIWEILGEYQIYPHKPSLSNNNFILL